MAKITYTFSEPFDIQAIVKAAIQVVDSTVDEVHRDFVSSARTLTHQPRFHKEKARLQGNVVRGSVWTDDENYGRLNEGTKDHLASGGRRVLMSFYPKYTPKTTPGRLMARSGGGFGKKVFAYGGPKRWLVRGIEPRKFDETIAAKNQPIFIRNAQAALNAALTK
jgi:hypothetical protein